MDAECRRVADAAERIAPGASVLPTLATEALNNPDWKYRLALHRPLEVS